MGKTAKDRLFFMLAGIAGSVLLLTGLSGTAAAATEPEYSLSASPSSISWPDSPDFQYRLNVKAGLEDLDLSLKFPDPGWGDSRTSGSVFDSEMARLEGPGSLAPGIMPPMLLMPSPDICIRGGGPWSSVISYDLTLGAGQQTTVLVDSHLAAAPFTVTPRRIEARVWSDTLEPVELTAPLAIGGKPGVLFRTRFAGAGEDTRIERRVDRSFRITGTTSPDLGNTLLFISAEQRTAAGSSPSLVTRKLATVRTDGSGRFRSGPLQLDRPGIWVLKVGLVKSGSFDSQPGCAGSVTARQVKHAVVPEKLAGRTFHSRRVIGINADRGRIMLRFFRDASGPNQSERSTMVASAGCNLMGGVYRAVNGRLRWTGRVISTAMGCPAPAMKRDRRIQRLLRMGMKAKLKGKRLTLTRGKTRIVLRQTSRQAPDLWPG